MANGNILDKVHGGMGPLAGLVKVLFLKKVEYLNL